MDENLMLLPADEMPQTDEVKKKPTVNCLQEIFLELLEERKVSLADVQKATGISWSTLYGWYKNDVTAQLADKNLLRLAQYFQVSLEYLCFGIGDSEEYKEDEEIK